MDSLADQVLSEVRKAAMALPMATERLSHGEPTWFVDGKKCFAMFCAYHHGLRLGLWCAAPLSAQEMLVQSDPDMFYRPPYVGTKGWVGINLDKEVDWDEIADLIREGYRHVAPAKYLKMLE